VRPWLARRPIDACAGSSGSQRSSEPCSLPLFSGTAGNFSRRGERKGADNANDRCHRAPRRDRPRDALAASGSADLASPLASGCKLSSG